MPAPRFLLLQVRDANDVMRENEWNAFARTLDVEIERIRCHDLLTLSVNHDDLNESDCVLIGGSGAYSACSSEAWLHRALDSLRLVYESRIPTFATCWGFQAFARALGGEVINDVDRCEVGTHSMTLTDAGRADPVFRDLPEPFDVQMGHEDRVSKLPSGAVLLASSSRVENQAYCFTDRPIYCTQFHPELNRDDLLKRVRKYPEYIERIAKMSLADFEAQLHDTPESAALLPKFVGLFLANGK